MLIATFPGAIVPMNAYDQGFVDHIFTNGEHYARLALHKPHRR